MAIFGATLKVEDVIREVSDSKFWTIFTHFGGEHGGEHGRGLHIPLLSLGPYFHITKFMMLELIAAGLIIAIFVPLARRAARSPTPSGSFWNLFESLLTFIRDEVARPCLMPPAGDHAEHGGHHGHAERPEDQADRYVPFLWTIFLFVLFCNLLGLVPTLGSPTASLWVTGALALCSFVMMHAAAIAKMGFVPYVKSLWPAMDVPFGMGYVIQPLIFIIEVVGTFIKSCVLAVRLFANMFAGHMVVGMILLFIVLVANSTLALWGGVTVASVLGVAALSLLELFVAFLQAYIFTFLTALFMGMALNPQH